MNDQLVIFFGLHQPVIEVFRSKMILIEKVDRFHSVTFQCFNIAAFENLNKCVIFFVLFSINV